MLLAFERGQPVAAQRRFVIEAADRGSCLGFTPARFGSRVARPVERRAGRCRVAKLREIMLRLSHLPLRLGQIGLQLVERL
jgi:hypothetical protein